MNRRLLPLLLSAALLLGALPAAASSNPSATCGPVPVEIPEEDDSPAEGKKTYSNLPVVLPTYEEALYYFDFTPAVENWCRNFGLDPESAADMASAHEALLAGTSHEFIRRLAAYARDTGHGEGSLKVTNAFRPAAYQELLGLYEANYYTGYFRSNIRWNRESVTSFWWYAEQKAGWPSAYTIDFSSYDLSTLNLSVVYRQLLSLWDTSYVATYYARPGCSNHNSGLAMDIGSDWLGKDFDTEHEYNGLWYRMEDYGIYKPLQPSPYTAGECWHITCGGAVSAGENYDRAFASSAEPYVLNYGNPALSGGAYDQDGRLLYLGAGVALLQLALARQDYLPAEYVTGFYCSTTDKAVKAFQKDRDIHEDICGTATCRALFKESASASRKDRQAPVLTSFSVSAGSSGILQVSASATDDAAPVLFTVYTRPAGSGDSWLPHPVCADRQGNAALDVYLTEDGIYELRCVAQDASGNESEPRVAAATVDHTGPAVTYAAVSTGEGGAVILTVRSTDLSGVRSYSLSAAGSGTPRTFPADAAGEGSVTLSKNADVTYTLTAYDLFGNPGEPLIFTVPSLTDAGSLSRPVIVTLPKAS